MKVDVTKKSHKGCSTQRKFFYGCNLKIAVTHNNHYETLVELECDRAQSSETSRLDLVVVARFGDHVETSEHLSAVIKLKRCNIKIEHDASKLQLINRHADAQRAQMESKNIERVDEASISVENAFESALGGNHSDGLLGRLAARTNKKINKVGIAKSEIAQTHDRVRALGGGVWELIEPEGGFLRGRIVGNDLLCGLKRISEGRIQQGKVIAYFRPDWIEIEKLYKNGKPLENIDNRTRNKILTIMLSKALKKRNLIEIIASEVMFEFEDA